MEDSNDKKSPFELLLENMDNEKVDLSKLKQEENRGDYRTPYTGAAHLTNRAKNSSSKAVIRNISPTGVGFEVNRFDVEIGDTLSVEFFGAGIGITDLKATVQWIAEIPRSTHLMVGLKFFKLTRDKQQKIQDFFEHLQKEAYKFI